MLSCFVCFFFFKFVAEIELEGKTFRPIDVTARILQDNWMLKPTDEEFTIIRITIEGDIDVAVYRFH